MIIKVIYFDALINLYLWFGLRYFYDKMSVLIRDASSATGVARVLHRQSESHGRSDRRANGIFMHLVA